jgi:hypothetical protein
MSNKLHSLKSFIFLTSLAATPLQAAEQWFLMARHGECANIESLKRKIPDLGAVTDPQSFAALMRKNGYATTITQQPLPKGKALEVIVPAKELSLVFVTAELCSTFSAR